MPHSEANDNLEESSERNTFSLVADKKTGIILSDIPVLVTSLNLKEDIATLKIARSIHTN